MFWIWLLVATCVGGHRFIHWRKT